MFSIKSKILSVIYQSVKKYLLHSKKVSLIEMKQIENNSLLALINIEIASRSFIIVSFFSFNFSFMCFPFPSHALEFSDPFYRSLFQLFHFIYLFIFFSNSLKLQLQTCSFLSRVTWPMSILFIPFSTTRELFIFVILVVSVTSNFN